MGRNSTKELVRKIAEQLSTEPQSISEISDAIDADRKAVTRYLEALSAGGLIKEDQMGRERLFWKPVLSDKQAGLELREIAYSLNKAAAMEKVQQDG